MGFFMILGFGEEGPAHDVLDGLIGEKGMEFWSEQGWEVIRLEQVMRLTRDFIKSAVAFSKQVPSICCRVSISHCSKTSTVSSLMPSFSLVNIASQESMVDWIQLGWPWFKRDFETGGVLICSRLPLLHSTMSGLRIVSKLMLGWNSSLSARSHLPKKPKFTPSLMRVWTPLSWQSHWSWANIPQSKKKITQFFKFERDPKVRKLFPF